MKLTLSILMLLIAMKSAAQIVVDTISKTVTTKSKANIFKGPNGKIIEAKEYLEMLNSGLYENRLEFANDSTLYSLDSTSLIKTLNTVFIFPELIDNKNKKVKIKKGEPTVVNFFSLRCKPCIEEITMLNKFVETYPNFNYLAITPDDTANVNIFLQKWQFRYNIIPNVKNIEDRFKINGFPTHILIDKNGTIRKIIAGKLNGSQDLLLNTF